MLQIVGPGSADGLLSLGFEHRPNNDADKYCAILMALLLDLHQL